MRSASWKSRPTALAMVLAVALGAAACGSTGSSSTTTAAGGSSSTSTGSSSRPIPASAFSDHTGVTSNSVQIGNVSTLSLGLFKGAQVGTQAYVDYVNSTGGVNGRKLVVEQRRRRLHRGRQQAGHPERRAERLRPGRQLLAGGQLRWCGAGPESRVPRRLAGVGQRHEQAAQRLQPDPPGRRLGVGADDLLPQQVHGLRQSRRSLPGRLAFGVPDLGGGEVRRGEGGVQVRVGADLRHHPDRLHPAGHRHEERRREDRLHGPDAVQLRVRRSSRHWPSRTTTLRYSSVRPPTPTS